MWLIANDYAPIITISENPAWFIMAFILMPIWSAFHFYWAHRFLHIPFFYTRLHNLHHRNIDLGPWSSLSMHPVEHFIYLSSICIHWVIVSHPLHLIFYIIYQGPGAAMTHTGYEDLPIKNKRHLALVTFYHTLHHRYFECNYGQPRNALGSLVWDISRRQQ